MRKVQLASAITALVLSTGASAVTVTYTDRGLWEAAITGAITAEDFNALTPSTIATDTTTSIGLLSIETFNTDSGTHINDGTGARNIDGSNYLQVRTDGGPIGSIRSANLILPESIYAWGMDFSQYGDQTHVSFLDITEQPIGPHNSSGFIGFVSDTAFSQIALTDPYISFSDVGIDNFSYVSAVPVPAAVWFFGSGLIGLIGVARRKKV